MIIKWSRLQVIFLAVAIVLAIGLYVGGYFLYIAPSIDKVEGAERELTIRDNVLKNAKQALAEDAENQSTELQRALPVEKATDQLLLLLYKVEQDSKSTITELSVAESVVENSDENQEQTSALTEIQTIQYQLRVDTDNYQGMYNFLQGLHDAERLLNIEQLEFGEKTGDQMNFMVVFSAYYSPKLSELTGEAPEYDFEPSEERTTPFE